MPKQTPPGAHRSPLRTWLFHAGQWSEITPERQRSAEGLRRGWCHKASGLRFQDEYVGRKRLVGLVVEGAEKPPVHEARLITEHIRPLTTLCWDLIEHIESMPHFLKDVILIKLLRDAARRVAGPIDRRGTVRSRQENGMVFFPGSKELVREINDYLDVKAILVDPAQDAEQEMAPKPASTAPLLDDFSIVVDDNEALDEENERALSQEEGELLTSMNTLVDDPNGRDKSYRINPVYTHRLTKERKQVEGHSPQSVLSNHMVFTSEVVQELALRGCREVALAAYDEAVALYSECFEAAYQELLTALHGQRQAFAQRTGGHNGEADD